MKIFSPLLISFLLIAFVGGAQSVGIGTNTPHPSSLLDLASTTRGFLAPRMTETDRKAIADPAIGLLVFELDSFSYWVFRGAELGGWAQITTTGNGLWSSFDPEIMHNTNIAMRVGIGTTTPHPSALLDVSSTTQGFLTPRMRSVDRTAIANPEEGLIVFDINTLSFWVYRGEPDGGWSEISTNNNGLWQRNGTKIYNTNTGYVGIGTNNPQAPLHIDKNGLNVGIILSEDGVTGGTIAFEQSLNLSNLHIKNVKDDGRVKLSTQSTTMLLNRNTNSVSIGPTPWSGPTLILADIDKDPELRFQRLTQGDPDPGWKGFVQIAGDNIRIGTNVENPEGKFVVRTAGTDRVAVDKFGNMGVGTTLPAVRFQVGINGDGTVARANAWTTFSDERYKENISTIDHALDKIDALNGYYYTWKTGEDRSRQAGLLAQEVEKVLPEIVNTDSEGYKSVDYGKMNALLLQALKEQQKQISTLMEKLSALEK